MDHKPKVKLQLINVTLLWRHNGRDSVSNHHPHDCLLNRLLRHRSKKTSMLRVTGLCVRNSPGTGEFPAQMASNAENVSIWWRHHGKNGHRLFIATVYAHDTARPFRPKDPTINPHRSPVRARYRLIIVSLLLSCCMHTVFYWTAFYRESPVICPTRLMKSGIFINQDWSCINHFWTQSNRCPDFCLIEATAIPQAM